MCVGNSPSVTQERNVSLPMITSTYRSVTVKQFLGRSLRLFHQYSRCMMYVSTADDRQMVTTGPRGHIINRPPALAHINTGWYLWRSDIGVLGADGTASPPCKTAISYKRQDHKRPAGLRQACSFEGRLLQNVAVTNNQCCDNNDFHYRISDTCSICIGSHVLSRSPSSAGPGWSRDGH